jgi:uncharacterized protein YcgL (UPF0745 family)
MTEKTFVSVFRSHKKPDTYLFVRRGQVWDELPDSLRVIFGTPALAMELIMTTERKLARTSGKQVLDAIQDKGFFLQMPEEQSGHVVDFRRKPEQQLDRRGEGRTHDESNEQNESSESSE